MEQELLNNLVAVNPLKETDVYAPYSFLEWRSRRPAVLEKDLFIYYNRYLLQWFEKNKTKTISTKFLLRQKYLFLLDQLQLFFTSDEKNNWYQKINLADEKELLLSIPYFAKKLKNIALYYLKLRKRIKSAKIKYNSVGSVRGIETEIYQHIIENFSSSNVELDPELQDVLPDIQQLKNQLVVKVEELYDDAEYMDRSLNVPLSSYVDIFHEPTARFFSTKGIILSSDEWIFKTFAFPASSAVEDFVENFTNIVFEEQTENNLYGAYIQQYIAEDKLKLTFFNSTFITQNYDVALEQGNNYFFYPEGTTNGVFLEESPFAPVSLSSLNVAGATAGEDLETSDTMFVKAGNDFKGAWLYFKEYQDENTDVVCLMNKDSTTSFLFPFAGYGLAEEDTPWSGPSLITEDEYQFLPSEQKVRVQEAYWSQVLPTDSTTPLTLTETTLAADGAKAGLTPTDSDKLSIRTERSSNTKLPRGPATGAWLYKFKRTALPISSSEDQSNVIVWPYSRQDEFEDQEFLNSLLQQDLSDVCSPVSIQQIDTSYFTAASSFELADKIYKLESYDKTLDEEATECCWLSSAEVITGDFKYFKQAGTSFEFEPGGAHKFIWCGPEMSIASVFAGTSHEKDCPFYVSELSALPEDWQECSCKQVFYSPFGHNKDTFQAGNQHADYICEHSSATSFTEEFVLEAWTDDSNQTFQISERFAWYKTDRKWGNGSWHKADGTESEMKLMPGKCYIYKRAGTKTITEHPSYVVFKKFYSKDDCFADSDHMRETKWVSARKTDTGTWESTNKDSTLELRPGDILKFDRQQNTTFFYLSSIPVENFSENRGSAWSSIDYIAFDTAANSTNITWPFIEGPFLLENYNTQAPPIEMQSISAIVAWKIECEETPTITDILKSPFTYNEGISSNIYSNIFTYTFVPPQTGTYSISVTAVDNEGVTYNIPNETTFIPKISVVPQYSEDKLDIPFETKQASTLVEHELSGWNYTTSEMGAKPFWAILYNEKDQATKFKGIKEWGFSNTYFENYLPNALPKLSPLTINFGNQIDYERTGRSFYWTQPVLYRTSASVPQWCKLEWDTSSSSALSSVFNIGSNPNLKVQATFEDTDIILSNNLNGAPVEIYYNAIESFTWSTSAVKTIDSIAPQAELYYSPDQPNGLNLSNRFYSTVATVPTLHRTYTEKEVGSYFTSQNLGASQYINTNFTASLKNPELTGSYIVEDTNIHIGGRGLTREEQPTLYTWEENNEWLKEPPTTNGLAGTVKKELTKTLQTFVPYQAEPLQSSVGIVSPNSNFSPWGGPQADQWIDKTNEPISFTGIRNVSSWEEDQLLNKNQQTLDGWSSDIFGNQYGLFKSLSGVPIWQRLSTDGELWVKTNGGLITPATKALSSLNTQFSRNETITIYEELTGKKVLNIDCFFDTLMIQTSSAFILGKITYDYETDQITFNTDDTRYKQLTSGYFDFEQTWFLPQEKTVISLFTEHDNVAFYPTLYSYDLNTGKFVQLFPLTTNEQITLQQTLSSYTPQHGCLCYNSSTRTYGITYVTKDQNDDLAVINIKLNRLEDLELDTISVFENRSIYQLNTNPPAVLSQYLSAIPVSVDQTFNITVSAYGNPTSYELLQIGNGSNQITVDNDGTFTGTLTAEGVYHINYSISNEVGSTYYSLTLSAA